MRNKTMKSCVALVYLIGNGCKQYAFETVEEVAEWSARYPYKNETVRVMAVKDRKLISDGFMPAAEVAEFVRSVRAAA